MSYHSSPQMVIIPLYSSNCLFFYFYFLIFFWLCWVFVSVRGLFLVAASGGHSSSRCAGLSPSRPLLLRSTGSRRAGSVVVAHGPSCSAACGLFPDQSSNTCPLHQQADSQPLCHQGSPIQLSWSMNWFSWKCLVARHSHSGQKRQVCEELYFVHIPDPTQKIQL